MTRPTVIFFGPDAGPSTSPKVYFRSLLFSTSKRGRVIESMHVSLSRNENRQNFSIWVYGEKHLMRGSGLFVGETGISANHHFLTQKEDVKFCFVAGSYHVEVYAKLVGDRKQILLFSQTLEVTREEAKALETRQAGLYFDWGPDASRYLKHVDTKLDRDPEMVDVLLNLMRSSGSVVRNDDEGEPGISTYGLRGSDP